jgi:hypothetical protein
MNDRHLNVASTAGTTTLGVSSGGSWSTDDEVFVRAEDNDDEFEVVKVAAVSTSTGVKLSLTKKLIYSYTTGDTVRHKDYWPSCVCMDQTLTPDIIADKNLPSSALYRTTISFVETS